MTKLFRWLRVRWHYAVLAILTAAAALWALMRRRPAPSVGLTPEEGEAAHEELDEELEAMRKRDEAEHKAALDEINKHVEGL